MNEAMGTVVGELIQMNAHMADSYAAQVWLIIGVCFVAGGLIAATALYKEGGWKFVVAMLAVVALGVVAIVHGNHLPKEKIIHACVNGPISLEQVSAVYDIVKIDGKELVLRER